MARFLKLETGISALTHFTDTSGHWSGNAIEALYNGKFLVLRMEARKRRKEGSFFDKKIQNVTFWFKYMLYITVIDNTR